MTVKISLTHHALREIRHISGQAESIMAKFKVYPQLNNLFWGQCQCKMSHDLTHELALYLIQELTQVLFALPEFCLAGR